jgi:hypothetical protein
MRKLALAFGLTSLAFMAQGAVIPSFQGPATPSVSNPGAWTYAYNVSLAGDQQLDDSPEPTVVIFDFNGYIPGSLVVSDPGGLWVGSAQPFGPDTVGNELPVETDEFNLVLRCPSCPTIVGPQESLFVFFADSTFGPNTQLNPFTGQSSKFNPLSPTETGTPTGNNGQVDVPAGVPEPATMSLMGGALLGLAVLARRRMA